MHNFNNSSIFSLKPINKFIELVDSLFDGNNDIPENKSFHDSDTCVLYGKIVKNDASIEETVDGEIPF